jgi:hypothetical protein
MYVQHWWGKPEGKKPLEIPSSRWVNKKNINLGIEWYGLD